MFSLAGSSGTQAAAAYCAMQLMQQLVLQSGLLYVF
jgi:hypothetical protein